jgi:hypothetical protein
MQEAADRHKGGGVEIINRPATFLTKSADAGRRSI